jgi:hypothetical protein
MTSQETELRTALRPWTDRAAGMIERRLEDARQHARGGSIGVGRSRLTELFGSLDRHISDARASFYRQAFQQHGRAGLDPEVHQVGLGPDHQGELAARAAPLFGRHYRDELLDVVADAQASLTSAALAEISGSGSFLNSWAGQNRDRLAALTARQLSDGQIAIFEAVGQILVKPELR